MGNKFKKKKSNIVDPTYQALSNVLTERNKNLNFVDRYINPESYPVIQNDDNSISTHLMGYSTDDEGNAYIYPEIVYENNKLNKLTNDEAWNYAIENKEYIKSPSNKLANYFTEKGYKNYNMNKLKKKYKNGGYTKKYNYGGNVEVENNEVAQLPTGDIMQFSGATHENGGIDVSLPNNTKIYSDRISIDGKTMQERKLTRERNIKKLQNKIKKNPYDKVATNTFKRVSQKAEMEDAQDMIIQESFNIEQEKMAYGGFTGGNIIGAIGTLGSAIAPLLTTQANKRATQPNRNTFKNLNKDAIATLNKAQPLIDKSRQSNLANLRLTKNSAYARNRNAVQSPNVLAALNIATDTSLAAQQADVESVYAQQELSLLPQVAQLESQQAYQQAVGEQQKLLEDKQDIDNYYSNLSQNYANIGMGLQNFARSLNQQEYGNDMLSLIPELSKYGLDVEKTNQGYKIVNPK